jgi:hypothetical protein
MSDNSGDRYNIICCNAALDKRKALRFFLLEIRNGETYGPFMREAEAKAVLGKRRVKRELITWIVMVVWQAQVRAQEANSESNERNSEESRRESLHRSVPYNKIHSKCVTHSRQVLPSQLLGSLVSMVRV